MTYRPKPPSETTAAIVAVATTCRNAERMPEMISGSATGSSTLVSTSRPGHPHALGRVPDGRVDGRDAGVGVGQDRRDRQDHQHRDRRAEEREFPLRRCPDPRAPAGSAGRGSAGRARRWPARRPARSLCRCARSRAPIGSAMTSAMASARKVYQRCSSSRPRRRCPDQFDRVTSLGAVVGQPSSALAPRHRAFTALVHGVASRTEIRMIASNTPATSRHSTMPAMIGV